MSQCVSCSNQPSTNDSLGGAAHEGTVTPMVIGIIVGTVIVFIIVVCALFYCVKLENHRYMAKVGEGDSDLPAAGGGGGGGGGGQQHLEQEERLGDAETMNNTRDASSGEMSVKSRHSSVTMQVVVPPAHEQQVVQEVGNTGGGGGGGKRRLIFGWGKKGNSSTVPSTDNTPVTAIEMV